MANGGARPAEVDPATGLEEADIALSERVTAQRKHPLVRALGALGELGDQPPLLTLSAGMLAFGLLTRRRRVAVSGANMLLSLAIATAAKTAVKKTVSRTRPHVLLDEGNYDVEALGPDEGPWHSFPSGHTAGSVAVALAFARVNPGAALPAYAAAGTIAAVQLPTAHHFATDIIAGATIGLAADLLTRPAARLAPALLEPEPGPPGVEEAGPRPG